MSMKLQFSIDCPHCGRRNEQILWTDDVEGAFEQQCRQCHNYFLNIWSATVEISVYKCDRKKTEVYAVCEAYRSDEEDWEEEEEEPEAEA